MQVKTIADQLFFTTVRIDTVDAQGGRGSGTGFFFQYASADDKRLPVCVTNKHVVMGMREGSFTFVKEKDGQPALGEGMQLKVEPSDWGEMWFGHPDPKIDIAICPLLPLLDFVEQHYKTTVFYRSVGSQHLPTPDQLNELDAVEPVVFIGYPNGIWDSKNLLPVARRGTTASPIVVDFEQTPRFLVDASVFGGSSGSPVFVLNTGTWTTRTGGVVLGGQRLYFVGVIAAVFYREDFNRVVAVPIPTNVQPMVQQREMLDLGIVFKARTVVETIEAWVAANGAAADANQPKEPVPSIPADQPASPEPHT
ncbi:MAG TPA: hypothetical protein VF194_07230 [Ferrovibrio sp.]|uniref:hypothetical protein n=1 Tax=Ferrovibrio sp. TaxID=1917215 RepID=UPI002ED22B53